MTDLIGITGASGALGGTVARLLADRGVQQRLLVRTPARAPRLGGAQVAAATYGDRAASVRALDGVTTLLMVSATESPERVQQHNDFVHAAAEAGVRHVVYTSMVGAAEDATFTFARDHWATEQHLQASGVDVTVLRDNFYMDVTGYLAGPDGVIRGPAGSGEAAFVARADVAAAAAGVLLAPAGHAGRTYELTGPQALSFDDVAAALTATGPASVRYQRETVDEAYESRRSAASAEWQLEAWVTTYTTVAAGNMATVSGDLPRLLRRPATTYDQYLANRPASA